MDQIFKMLTLGVWAFFVILGGCGGDEEEEEPPAEVAVDEEDHSSYYDDNDEEEEVKEAQVPDKVEFSQDTFSFILPEAKGISMEEPIPVKLYIKGTGELAKRLEGKSYKYLSTPRVYDLKGAKLHKDRRGYLTLHSPEFVRGDGEPNSGGAFFQALTYESKQVSTDDFSDTIVGDWWSWNRLNFVRFPAEKQKNYERITTDGRLPPMDKENTRMLLHVKYKTQNLKMVLHGSTLQYLLDGYVQGLEAKELRLKFQGFGKADEKAFIKQVKGMAELFAP